MNRAERLESWLREERQPFEGWDFSYLNGRMFEDQPPWSYMQQAAERMQATTVMLDMDTGGGERLLDLRPHWPSRTVATENYLPNVRLAHKRLSPLGVQVVMASSDERIALPFASGSFDLIVNRHAAFSASELARILAPGGTFLTRQVHGQTARDLLEVFGASPQWPDAAPEKYVPLLQASGLTIVTLENWQGRLRFRDVGALVYYLKAVPWLVPDFSVETYQDTLFSLQKQLEDTHELAFESRIYWIEARKEPAGITPIK